MISKKIVISAVALAFAASLASADIYVKQGDATFVHPAGNSLKLTPSKKIKVLSVSHNGTEMNLNSQAAYTFNETKVGGRKALQIDMFKNAYIEIGDTVITNKGSKSSLMMTPKEGSNKVNVQVVSGKVSVKLQGGTDEKEIAAASSFSILDVSEIAATSDGAHYKFEEDLTQSISSSNP
ncbi:MAG: hypothetical protein LBO62_04425 [Endomicrobium sp.]|jgi:hypothetical protein|nr:hypothetical protein [Endomicrobium sp.]